MKKVLLSYDYELYFNFVFCDEIEALVKPADLIYETYKQTNIRCTFFVDTECILKYKQIGKIDVVNAIEKQLQKFVSEGFDIQLHLHPLWDLSEYCKGTIVFNYEDYDLKNISFNRAKNYLIRGKEYLESLLKKVKPNYKCIAFRAGGFCFPNNEDFITALYDNGILIDSSIAPNTILNSKFQSFNYFGKKSFLNSNAIYEIPLLTVKKMNLYYLLNHKKLSFKACLRGKGSPVIYNDSRFCRLIKSIRENALITLDTHNCRFITKCLLMNNSDVISLIGHPKFENEEAAKNTLNLILSTSQMFEYLTFSQFVEGNCDNKNN